MACEHQWALYPVDPQTGKRLSQRDMGRFGGYYQTASFCMLCGEPEGAQTIAPEAEPAPPPVHPEG